jgi:hypothetical protein
MYREVQMRNALVTGNVSGLGSFRGNVGYSAPSEFRGSLGSDQSYSFRRSAASSIGQRSIRGGDAIRYQMGNTTGSSYNSGSLISRSGLTGRNAAQAAPGSESISARQSSGFGYSPLNSSLRSTATFTSGQSLQPRVLTRTDAAGTDRTTLGSSLLGVRELPNSISPAFQSPADKARDELRPGQVPSTVQPISQSAVNRTSDPLVENLAPGMSLSRSVVDELRDRQAKLASEKAMGRAAVGTGKVEGDANAASGEQAPRVDAWQERVAELRRKLLPKSDQDILAGRRFRSPLQQLKDNIEEQKRGISKILDDDTVAVLRDGAGQTRQFVAAGGNDAYSEHMTNGQKLMGEGRYFDAEERFSKALAAKDGDPTALAGRLHAQLGAGLYLSAGVNLRDLFSNNPEVIAMRYTGDTIPPPDRLVSIASDLRARINRMRDLGGVLSIDEGLLLSYIAWQLGDAGLVSEGLVAADAADKQRVSTGEEADPLIEVLRKVWLPGSKPQETPAPAPTP